MSIIVQCPHCGDFISIVELNCLIFRHAVLISNGQQINPHASKEECDSFVERGLVYGCAKPFRLVKTNDDAFVVEKCNYI